MSGNTFGKIFKLTTYGESHGVGVGGIVDGCPAGLVLNEEIIQRDLDKRKPGQGSVTATSRRESDTVKILSGVFEGETTGTPIAFQVLNTNQNSSDYDKLRDIYRPEHADEVYDAKYGIRDHRGGGRASGRETVSRVAGGAIASVLLEKQGISLVAYTLELGGIRADLVDVANAQDRPFFAPDDAVVRKWEEIGLKTKQEGDTLGGLVRIEVLGVPAGLGEPVFDKLDALFAHAMMSVGAVKGVEIGAGFAVAQMKGSENNDLIDEKGNYIRNMSGGILGGISSGRKIVITCAVKPIASIGMVQRVLNKKGQIEEIKIGGRHDVSAIPRIVPVLKAMGALVLADALLLNKRFL